jgi:uncharacterized surface protein with fasciclin (FAS1) repeats
MQKFVPSAFAKLHPDFIIHLKKNLTAMVNLLQGHVIPLTYYSAGIPAALDVKTLYGNTIHISNTDGEFTIHKFTYIKSSKAFQIVFVILKLVFRIRPFFIDIMRRTNNSCSGA